MENPTTQSATPVYVIGDVHGQLRPLLKLLEHAGLIGHEHGWTGKQAIVWFIGDLVDRGRESIGVVDLVMRLQSEAAAVGGYVGCLLGNHEMLMLGAYRFGRRSTGLSSNFITKWVKNGGQRDDLAKLTRQHLDWFANLPAMAQVGNILFVHADSTFYTRYGRNMVEVNAAFKNILSKSSVLDWEEMIEEFSMRGVFSHQYAGEEFIERFLTIFKGEKIVHGHTPISLMLNCNAKKVTEAHIYAGGRCINVDGGLHLGGPGFVYQMHIPASVQIA